MGNNFLKQPDILRKKLFVHKLPNPSDKRLANLLEKFRLIESGKNELPFDFLTVDNRLYVFFWKLNSFQVNLCPVFRIVCL